MQEKCKAWSGVAASGGDSLYLLPGTGKAVCGEFVQFEQPLERWIHLDLRPDLVPRRVKFLVRGIQEEELAPGFHGKRIERTAVLQFWSGFEEVGPVNAVIIIPGPNGVISGSSGMTVGRFLPRSFI